MPTNEHHETLDAVKAIITILEPLSDEKRTITLNMAGQLLGIDNNAASTSSDINDTTQPLSDLTPKAFIKEKAPKTDTQRVACLAYYLTHYRNNPHFKTADITKLNIEAAHPKFSNAAVSVKNATDQNQYLTQAGKGNKQITAYGEDVVSALPDQTAIKSLVAPKKSRKKSATKKSK